MPAVRAVELPGMTVTVRELTVAEVRTWVAEQEAGASVDPLRAMVFDDCGLDDLARMSDASADALEAFGHSELERVREACKALNPHFFKVRAILTGIARHLQEETGPTISTA
jgi:hypothetical protein